MDEFVSVSAIALGSNLPQPEGDPTENLKRAMRELVDEGQVIRAVSRFFQTPCFPIGAGPDYINAVALVATDASPRAVLEVLHRVEKRMGRTRETRWGMRTLDLDLLFVGDAVLPDADAVQSWMDLPQEDQKLRAPDQLILPHPRLADRAFVLVPLADVAPDWVHPLTGLNVRQMLQALPGADVASVRPV